MLIDIRGKINEKQLAFSQTLLPLYEAIVNSIHAIEDGSATKPGIIKISIIREKQLIADLGDSLSKKPLVENFIIEDNGIGFNERNFDSFNFAHSTYKENKGGKGIGRFTWLRAFNEAKIESVFFENEKWFNRSFYFKPTKIGVENPEIKELDKNSDIQIARKTIVTLVGLKKAYKKWCNNETEDIALKIIEHCFVYFLDKNCPIMKIVDGNEEIIVNDLFNVFTKAEQVQKKEFEIKENKFTIHIVKLYNDRLDNKIHYCAHSREVESEKISKDIPELDSYIIDENKGRFSIAAFITGDFLDKKVNEERTKIQFAQNNENEPVLEVDQEVTQEEIRVMALEIIKSQFENIITGLTSKRYEVVSKFTESHPRYKTLLKYKKGELMKIPSNLTEEKLELELFKVQQKLELETREEAKELLNKIDSVEASEDYKQKYDTVFQKISEVGKSPLAEYVFKRKVILELLDKKIKRNSDGSFEAEEAIHKLIFPLKSHSDEIGFEQHNLWVIDEKLAFHSYLASDIPFKKLKNVKIESSDRPDIILFKTPHALVTNERPFNSVVLIEFKRPMRKDYTKSDNPIEQINRYARTIRSGKSLDKDGREITIRKNIPIYSYIVCDITNKLRDIAADYDYVPFPDKDGYYSFNRKHNMYIEIISLEKLIRDSKQRNHALFHKLNLPES